jgi:hypothetical protein
MQHFMIFQNLFDVFFKFSMKIWPFYHLRIWTFLKMLMAKFGLFYFLGPGIPALQEGSEGERVRVQDKCVRMRVYVCV